MITNQGIFEARKEENCLRLTVYIWVIQNYQLFESKEIINICVCLEDYINKWIFKFKKHSWNLFWFNHEIICLWRK